MAIKASHDQQLRQIQMKEMDIVSTQLGQLSMIGAFLSSNAFFGLMEVFDVTEDTPPVQIMISLFYFLCVGIAFSSTVTVAVASEFVVFYGWEKAMKGRRDDLTDTIQRCYKFRLWMMKLLIVGVVSSMLMAATLQLSRPQTETTHHYYAAVVATVILGFTVFIIHISNVIKLEFQVEGFDWKTSKPEPPMHIEFKHPEHPPPASSNSHQQQQQQQQQQQHPRRKSWFSKSQKQNTGNAAEKV